MNSLDRVAVFLVALAVVLGLSFAAGRWSADETRPAPTHGSVMP